VHWNLGRSGNRANRRTLRYNPRTQHNFLPSSLHFLIGEPPEVGSTIMLGGYQQDHPLVLMVDPECRIVERSTDASGRLLVRHNCTGTRGDSGAPLLIEKRGKWYTVGVDVAAELGVASGPAIVLDEARRHL